MGIQQRQRSQRTRTRTCTHPHNNNFHHKSTYNGGNKHACYGDVERLYELLAVHSPRKANHCEHGDDQLVESLRQRLPCVVLRLGHVLDIVKRTGYHVRGR